MDTAVKVFQIVQAVVVITGLVWVLSGAIDFFGGRTITILCVRKKAQIQWSMAVQLESLAALFAKQLLQLYNQSAKVKGARGNG